MTNASSPCSTVDCELAADGRTVAIDILINGELVRIIFLYAPNNPADCLAFCKSLRSLLDTPSKIILAGDFNYVLSRSDCTTIPWKSDGSIVELKNIRHDFDLGDATEGITNFSPRFTHWQGPAHARLDRVFISGECSSDNIKYSAQPTHLTHHAFVSFFYKGQINRSRPNSGIVSWKLNTKILEDEAFRDQIRKELSVMTEIEPIST